MKENACHETNHLLATLDFFRELLGSIYCFSILTTLLEDDRVADDVSRNVNSEAETVCKTFSPNHSRFDHSISSAPDKRPWMTKANNSRRCILKFHPELAHARALALAGDL